MMVEKPDSEELKRRNQESEAIFFGQILERSLNESYTFDKETLLFVHVNYGARRNLGVFL